MSISVIILWSVLIILGLYGMFRSIQTTIKVHKVNTTSFNIIEDKSDEVLKELVKRGTPFGYSSNTNTVVLPPDEFKSMKRYLYDMIEPHIKVSDRNELFQMFFPEVGGKGYRPTPYYKGQGYVNKILKPLNKKIIIDEI